MKKRIQPLSTGSMADIAFLLLVFFLLVTEIPEDAGLLAQLPSQDHSSQGVTHERNLLDVHLGKEGELLVRNEYVSLEELQAMAVHFYRNGGILSQQPKHQDYPFREWVNPSSESLDARQQLALETFGAYRSLPRVAGIQLESRPFTPYHWYVTVNDALIAARRTVMNEVLESQNLPSFETIASDPVHRKTVQALEVLVPDRVTDIWLETE